MVKEISLILDQDPHQSAFAPGSIITGTVTLELTEAKQYRQITVSLKGKGKAQWTQAYSQYAAVVYSETEQYADEEMVVWKSEDSPDGTLPAGKHSYPFQLTLPTDCPSSFRTFWGTGTITYKVEAVVSTGPGKLDKKVEQPIGVVNVISAIGPRVQVLGENRKRVGHRCLAGEISINAQLEHSAYNIGEEIPVSFYVENGSGRKVTVRCDLVENKHFYAQGHHTSSTERIVRAVSEPIRSHTSSGQQVVRVPVPKNIRPAITKSNVIKTAYTVNVTLVVPFALNSTLKLPVMIVNDGVQVTKS